MDKQQSVYTGAKKCILHTRTSRLKMSSCPDITECLPSSLNANMCTNRAIKGPVKSTRLLALSKDFIHCLIKCRKVGILTKCPKTTLSGQANLPKIAARHGPGPNFPAKRKTCTVPKKNLYWRRCFSQFLPLD